MNINKSYLNLNIKTTLFTKQQIKLETYVASNFKYSKI